MVAILRTDGARNRIARWQYRFAEFNLEPVHIPGKENAIADGLSRLDILTNVLVNGRSGIIADFRTKREVGRYHLDTLKVFVPREDHITEGEGWQDMRNLALNAKQIWKKTLLEPDAHGAGANVRTRRGVPEFDDEKEEDLGMETHMEHTEEDQEY